MDTSKLNISLPYTFARLSGIDVLVTDQPLDEAYQKAARQAHVQLL
jgi:DeoR/GlpR family transcriptional regulator of sugar metabolism